MNFKFGAVGPDSLPGLGGEEPEHGLSNENDEWWKDEAEAIEEVLTDVDFPDDISWREIRITQRRVSAVEHPLVIWEHRLKAQVVEQCPQTGQGHYFKNEDGDDEVVDPVVSFILNRPHNRSSAPILTS